MVIATALKMMMMSLWMLREMLETKADLEHQKSYGDFCGAQHLHQTVSFDLFFVQFFCELQ